MPERISLVTGASALLRALGLLVVILAAAAIATSASPWQWKAGALLLLAAAAWFSFRGARGSRHAGSGTLNLDGTAIESRGREDVLLQYTGHARVSSLFSVIHFNEIDSSRKCSWLVCASNNHPDDYRRMLGYLRLSSDTAHGSES